ncbi:sulfite reductase flavo protein alpha-component [Piedraia hortae CBS 480.64]|uniref:Sulfite reductase flavo protein alpha-component n=1 Tax=Piedraia hortae CBS 480.64 TaxID=1314780 RepID=A0A6A7C500_9PEZI|nr:sulfite reductase flavo protein alpha-component [Piedraia hortae CBS 480.64]
MDGKQNVTSRVSPRRTALILYGSETGNAQDAAEEVGRLTERMHYNTVVLSLSSVKLGDLGRAEVAIFCISTTGQGEFPQNAKAFWRALLSSALKPGILRKVRFASFGLGDSNYVKYNVAHRMLQSRLIQLGAVEICSRGEGNEQHPEGYTAGFNEWITRLRSSLTLPKGESIIPESIFLKPRWKLQLVPSDEDYANPQAEMETPPSELLPIKGTHAARIVQNKRVTPANHFQDVRLLELKLEGDHAYSPGDVAIVHPKNFPSDVSSFLDLMNWTPIADRPLTLLSTSTNPLDVSPLSYLNQETLPLTLRYLLTNVLDIMSIPRRSLFSQMLHFVSDDEVGRYQRERLEELSNPSLIQEMWDYTTRPKRTILEVFEDFTSVKIPYEYALSILPRMKGRAFSIASDYEFSRGSSPDKPSLSSSNPPSNTPLHPNQPHPPTKSSSTKIELLIAITRPSSIIKRPRWGICTRYISTLSQDTQIAISLQKGTMSPPGDEPSILIGTGTGIAPLRALLLYKVNSLRSRGVLSDSQAIENPSHPRLSNPSPNPAPSEDTLSNWTLYFGCRTPGIDDYLTPEWTHLSATHGLNVRVAYSRHGGGAQGRYVQDVIREDGDALYAALVKGKGRVYLCGSKGNMPKGVREALRDILSSRGVEGDYLEQIEREGRVWEESW